MNSLREDGVPTYFQPFCVFCGIPVVGCFPVVLLLPRVEEDRVGGEIWAKFRTSGT